MYASFTKLISLFTLIFGLSACANDFAYNNDNPESYKKHWENNEVVKENPLHPFSEECKANRENICF